VQAELYREMLGRIQETDEDVPYRRGKHLYYSRTLQGKPYSIFCRKTSDDSREEVLLDQNELAEGHTYLSLGNLAVSHDETLLAFSINTDGDETYTVRVKDLRAGAVLPDEIPNTYYSFAWANDNRTFFYVTLDLAKRPYRIWRRQLREAESTLVYEETDERFELSLKKSRDGAFVLIESESKITSEVLFLRAGDPLGAFQPIWPRRENVLYEVETHEDTFYINTNDRAQDFRLMRVPISNPDWVNGEEVLPARDGVFLEDVKVFRRFLAAFERRNGLSAILIRELETGEGHYISFDEPAYTVYPGVNAVYDTETLRFNYSSLVTPTSVFDYNMAVRTRELRKVQPVLGGYDPAQYESERIFVPARDGAKVPVSLVRRKGSARDGQSPLLLYGYGSYGITIDPSFQSQRISLLDRGFTYAIAHIRGGAEMGRGWYEDGKILRKKNTFQDFVDVAQYLVNERYTSADRLAIQGGSAGGLLMGAVMNMRPDLFRSVIAQVPFVDVLTTDLDPTLPLTVGEYEEWGNANQQPYYDYIKSYSPYDNVRPMSYPNVLVMTGLNDPRVSYWEPAKWTAKLRAAKTDSNLLLLKTSMNAGHGGASDRYEKLKETAFIYAFLLKTLPARC
jgi:oligopeptidase B